MEKTKVYGYIRVSTATQADRGYGLETQEVAIIEYCEQNNLELVNIYRDEGISGAMGDADDLSKRQGMMDLLDVLNGINSIVVMNTSRLWRDAAAQYTISKEVRQKGGEIHSIEQPRYSLYSKDPHDFLTHSMIEMMDQFERLSLNMKLARGRTTKAKQGHKPAGRQPYGYKYDPVTKLTIIDGKESEIVKKIYEMFASGENYPAIVRYLNRYRARPRSGIEWNKQTIRNILRNDYYIGKLKHQGVEYNGKHEPIVDMELWDRVQSRMEELKG